MNLFSEDLWRSFRETLEFKESPLGVYYTNDKPQGLTPKEGITGCMIGLLQNARKKGGTVYFDKTHFGCPGGGYYRVSWRNPDQTSNTSCPAEFRERWKGSVISRHRNWPGSFLKG